MPKYGAGGAVFPNRTKCLGVDLQRGEPWRKGSGQLGMAKGRFAQAFVPPGVTEEAVGPDLVPSSLWSPTFLFCKGGT